MPAPTYDLRIDWSNDGVFDAGIPTGAQATAFSAGTVDYLVATDADAADVLTGVKVMLYNSGGVTLKHPDIYTVTTRPSAFGFTNINVVPAFPVATATNDVMKVVTVTGDDVGQRRLARSALAIQYGRDHARALAPTSPGEASFELDNTSRDYSPENASSPLAGKVLPARPVQIQATHLGTTYTLFRGQTDDFNVQPGPGQRSAEISCLDGLAMLQGVAVDIQLYQGVRTGTAIARILDAVGWSGTARDLDAGATIIPYWWEAGTDAWEAIGRLVQSEGIPAFVSIDPSGNFVFRDRHHRLTYSASLTSQATFRDAGTDPRFSWPLQYDHGWKDIVNSVRLEVNERTIGARAIVWESDSSYSLDAGETLPVYVSTTDPFLNALTPIIDEHYTVLTGTVTMSLSATSGAAVVINITADAGGPAIVTDLKLWANPVVVARTRLITASDTASQSAYGKRSPESLDAPWVTYQDGLAVAAVMLAQRAQRLPIVTIRLTGGNDTITTQQLTRDLSDRVTIVDAETGLNAPFFIERIEHSISGAGSQLHETTFACEKALIQPTNIFRFDTAGAGFNDGVFALAGLDDPTTMFRFDTSGHGFDQGVFAT